MKYFINPEQLYYTIEHPLYQNIKFTSKFDVLNALNGLPEELIKFNWFPDLWKHCDHTTVSTKSYDQLKLERALTLREKYKYLKLYFSGGSDSITVLNTFIKNGIHIDEIVNWKKSMGAYEKINPDIENDLSAIPYLKSIQHLIPKTKITISQLESEDLKQYNVGLGSGKEQRRIIFGEPAEMDFVPDHRYLYLKDNDNVGHIEGGQKPTIFYINGQWYFGMYDLYCTGFYNNGEDFFFDKENPELFLKTVHMIKNFMNTLLLTNPNRFKMLAYDRNKKEHRKELMPIIGRDPVASDVSLIKFHFNQHYAPILKFDGKKIKYPYIRTFEIIKSLINQQSMIDSLRNWSDSLDQVVSLYGENIKQDKHGEVQPVIGFKPILSTLYNIDNKADIIYMPDVEHIQEKVIVL